MHETELRVGENIYEDKFYKTHCYQKEKKIRKYQNHQSRRWCKI